MYRSNLSKFKSLWTTLIKTHQSTNFSSLVWEIFIYRIIYFWNKNVIDRILQFILQIAISIKKCGELPHPPPHKKKMVLSMNDFSFCITSREIKSLHFSLDYFFQHLFTKHVNFMCFSFLISKSGSDLQILRLINGHNWHVYI